MGVYSTPGDRLGTQLSVGIGAVNYNISPSLIFLYPFPLERNHINYSSPEYAFFSTGDSICPVF